MHSRSSAIARPAGPNFRLRMKPGRRHPARSRTAEVPCHSHFCRDRSPCDSGPSRIPVLIGQRLLRCSTVQMHSCTAEEYQRLFSGQITTTIGLSPGWSSHSLASGRSIGSTRRHT